MNRRRILKNALSLSAGMWLAKTGISGVGVDNRQRHYHSFWADRSKYSHRLPKSDQNYKRSKSYIEDDPIPEYTWASDEAYEAFLDMKYGVRIHWGLYSLKDSMSESWPFLGNREPAFDFKTRAEYNLMYKNWNPQGFNAEEWMKTFKEAGLQMFAFTTKHHEGFSMYDTKTRVKKRVQWDAPGGPKMEDCDLAYSIMETPFGRDIVKEVCEAGRKHGLKIDLYFSHSDWYDADFRPYGYHPLQIPSSAAWCKAKAEDEPLSELERAKERLKSFYIEVPDPTPAEEARMVARHREQLKEILSNYGKIDMVCLDIWLGPRVWPELRKTLMELRKIQPNVMFRARGIGNYGDYYTPERFVPGGKESSDAPWFVIYPLGSHFSYESNAAKFKGANWILQNLIDSVAKGGNFMVGIGPDGDGRFHPKAIEQLQEVGSWLKLNGKGIYATRARSGDLWKEGEHIRFTRSKDSKTLYVHAMKWPGKELVLQSVKTQPNTIVRALALPNQKLNWRKAANGELVITLPDALLKLPKVQQMAYSFSIEQVVEA